MKNQLRLVSVLFVALFLFAPLVTGDECIEERGDNFALGFTLHQDRSEALQNETENILYAPPDFNRSKCKPELERIKKLTNTTLYINGSSEDQSFYINQNINFTATLNMSDKKVYIDSNMTDWSTVNDTSPLVQNWTFENIGYYNVKAYFPGDFNYSASEDVHHITVEEVPVLQYSGMKASPSPPTTYSPDTSYNFNVTWSGDVDTAFIQQNFTTESENLENITMLNQSSEYYFDTDDLSAGTYYWKSWANNTDGEWEDTEMKDYRIEKAPTRTSLYLNSSADDEVYTVNHPANFTVKLNVSGKEVSLDSNMTDWTELTGTTPLQEVVDLDQAGTFNITGYFPGDENYAYSSESHLATVENPIETNVSLGEGYYDQEENIQIDTRIKNTDETAITGDVRVKVVQDATTVWTKTRTDQAIPSGDTLEYTDDVDAGGLKGRYNVSANFTWNEVSSSDIEEFVVTLPPAPHNLTVKFERDSGTATVPLEEENIQREISSEVGEWTDLEDNYICSENGWMGSIVANGPLHSAGISAGQGIITSSPSTTPLYLSLSREGCENVEERIDLVEEGAFMDEINPSFGYPFKSMYTAGVGLDYEDIKLVGEKGEGPGDYRMIIRNNGTDVSGETEVWIRLEPG